MREPNDIKLANNTQGLIDIVLGGHDHYYNLEMVKGIPVMRSGTDFRNLSYIEAWRKPAGGGWDFSILRRDIVRAIPEDPDTLQLVDKLTRSMQDRLEKPVGYTAAPLDGRFTTVRTRESNLANFVCDLMRHYYDADCALMAAGTVRGDQVYPPGVVRIRDIMNCFPFEDPVVVLRVSGQALLEALENSVSMVPALDGRFPQVSNIFFEFDPTLPPGSRVKRVRIGNEPLDRAKYYSLATRAYMAHGKDGFDSLLLKSEGGQAEEIVSEENGMILSTMLRQYFLSLKILGRWRRFMGLHQHWDEVKSKLHQQHEIKDSAHPVRHRPKQDMSAAEIRDRAPVAFHHGGKLVDPQRARQEHPAVPDEALDSDSDGSIADLDEHRPTVSTHPLSTPDTRAAAVVAASTDGGGGGGGGEGRLSNEDSDRLYRLARYFGKKWMDLAGIERGRVQMVGEHGPNEIPSWTKGIAPRVEGRIVVLGKE